MIQPTDHHRLTSMQVRPLLLVRRLSTLTLLVLTVSCTRNDPAFCCDSPQDCTQAGAADHEVGCTGGLTCVAHGCVAVPVMHCTGDEGCAANPATLVCDVTRDRGACVQCTPTEPAACTGTTPVCDPSSDSCARCTQHADCPSAVCLPDGACGNPLDVAYVDPAGSDTAACTKAMPCTKLSRALTTNRPFVKLHATTTEQVAINNQHVTLLADPGAKLTSTTNGVLVKVDGTSTVAIYDLEISGASGMGSVGISMPTGNTASLSLHRVKLLNNSGGGISASGGTLTIDQSSISGNSGGGISMAAPGIVAIMNTFIDHNGNIVSGSFGGLSLRPVGASKVEFNTIVDNQASTGAASAGGIFCDTAGFAAPNNIIFRNTGGATGATQTFGNCTYGNSFNAQGSSSVDNSLRFVNSNSQPFDYHLTMASPISVRDAAGPCTGVDFDDDQRPIGGACDLGADEFKP